jgi:UBX domain-containing protein 7
MDTHPDGQTYCQRYKVYNYPHLAIIDPRTGRLMWSKEGWTLENPVTAETFSEMAMDFCSRNSLDRPPQAPKVGASAGKRPATELSEAEQLKAALQASMKDSGKASKEGINNNDEDDDDDDGDEYQYDDDGAADAVDDDSKPTAVSTTAQTTKPLPPPPPPPLVEQLRAFVIPEEPKNGGARVQIKLADGKRLVRTFSLADPVRTVYAYIVVRRSLYLGLVYCVG